MKTLRPEEMNSAMEQSALLREKLLADPYRPGYHFAMPGDFGIPGDPNGAFYANGRYHLMYLYASRSDNFRYGHLSSTDLLHWRRHPDAVFPDEYDGGIFSGGAFVDEDGTAYLTYWGLPTPGAEAPRCHGGVRIAYSRDVDNNYEKWEKFPEYAIPATEFGVLETKLADGTTDLWGCSDPSNIWKANGYYYLQTGALVVLNKYRDNPASPKRMVGDWTDLFRSSDMEHWEHTGRFYARRADNGWTDESEDDMCPSFLPLPYSPEGGEMSDRFLQLFIAHNKGAQYYIGTYEAQKGDNPFTPLAHGRMSWKDNAFFAPEALIDPKGRHIMWAWLRDDIYADGREITEKGWSGVYSLPRVLWLRPDDTLGIDVAPEVLSLRYGEPHALTDITARCAMAEIRATLPAGTRAGVRVYYTAGEYVDVYADRKDGQLVFDGTHAGYGASQVGNNDSAPFVLDEKEALDMKVFVDHSVVEVFVNGRQAMCRRGYFAGRYAPRMEPIMPENGAYTARAWQMMETNPF